MSEISVIIPVYNGQQYIKSAIDSILSQTLKNFELIIIDDGSSDGTPEIITKYAKHDSRIIFKSRDNVGMVATMKELEEMAACRYVARMDADDIAMPNRLLMQKKFLDTNPEFVLVGSQIIQIDSKNNKIGRPNLPTSHDEILNGLLLKPDSTPVPIIHPTVMIRRSSLLSVGGYDPSLTASEDRDLWLKLSSIGKLANLPETLLHYRRHFASFTSTRSDESRQLRKQVILNYYYRNNLPLPNLIEDSVGRTQLQWETYLQWSKQSLSSNFYQSSFRYFILALVRQPFSVLAWKQGLKIAVKMFKN